MLYGIVDANFIYGSETKAMEVRLGLWNRVVEKDRRVCGLNEVDAIVPGEDLN